MKKLSYLLLLLWGILTIGCAAQKAIKEPIVSDRTYLTVYLTPDHTVLDYLSDNEFDEPRDWVYLRKKHQVVFGDGKLDTPRIPFYKEPSTTEEWELVQEARKAFDFIVKKRH